MDETRDNVTDDRPRKPYVKPEIQEVPLRPEEAVLGGCKTASKSGSAQFRCTFPKKCSSTTS
jgi:hypothetical protein